MRILFVAFFSLNALWLASCQTKKSSAIPEDVLFVLNSSGKNKVELYKAVNYFLALGNMQKKEALFFLIRNLPGQYHFDGSGMIRYRKVFSRMDSITKTGNGIFPKSWDSLQKIYPAPGKSSVTRAEDIQTIKSVLLIRHINAAFRAWNYPWARSLDFQSFCTYILPYKLRDELPEPWMDKVQNEYRWLIDSMKGSSDAKKACIYLNNALKRKVYLNHKFRCNWDMNYEDLKQIRQGKCLHITQLATYVMRGMGIPVTMDMTPHWGNKGSGHEWNTLFYKNKFIQFVGSESDPGKTKLEFTREEWIRRKVPKIFRRTYVSNQTGLEVVNHLGENSPYLFADQHYVDVTNSYVPVSDLSVSLNGSAHGSYVYLCVFNDKEWRTTSVSKIGFWGNAKFENMGRSIVYLPMYLEEQELIPAGCPFYLTGNGEQIMLCRDDHMTEKITIKAKYPEEPVNEIHNKGKYQLFYWNDAWVSLGVQNATGKSIAYDRVPTNALLWLRSWDKNEQERIFTIEKGKQAWH